MSSSSSRSIVRLRPGFELNQHKLGVECNWIMLFCLKHYTDPDFNKEFKIQDLTGFSFHFSFFGNFKHIIERSPQTDMNRTVLLIPALCGKLTNTTVTQALRQASQADIEAWGKKHISYTVQKKRRAFFIGGDSQNMGKSKAA